MHRLGRTLPLTAVAVAVIVLAAAALAQAAGRGARSAHSSRVGSLAGLPTLKSPAEPGLTLGISGAQFALTSGTAKSEAGWNQRTHYVGAQIIRLSISWAAIAPTTRPSGFDAANQNSAGYDWSGVDSAVDQLTKDGYTILLQVLTAPTWAEGSNMPADATYGTWEPNATAFGQFMTALATRFDGHTADPANSGKDLPRVSDWQAWNEPNLSVNLAPQWVGSGTHVVAESPTLYRNLDDALYTSVKKVSSTNFVVGAGTAPYGDPPGGQRMSPVTFDQNLFCLNGDDKPDATCPKSTQLDAVDNHPYVSGLCCLGPYWHAQLTDDTSIADMYKIVRVLKAAQAAHTVTPAGTKAVWASEVGWNTDPPNPNKLEASPAATVARWETQGLYLLWLQGVHTVLWYQLTDDAEGPNGWNGVYTEGLYYHDGDAKPGAASFRFPFLTIRKTGTKVMAWGRAPKAGTLVIQKLSGKRWISVGKMTVKADQVFETMLPLAGAGSFRAVVGGDTSPAWAQSA